MRILTIDELVQITGGSLTAEEKAQLKAFKEQIKAAPDKETKKDLKAQYKVLKTQLKGSEIPS